MPEMMKAFVMKAIGEVGFMEKPVPEPGPNDAIIKTTRALVCTSDTHTVCGAIGERTDLTLGHEAVGIIHRLGGAVKGFEEGQRVAVGAITPDFTCDYCQAGAPSQCNGLLGGWKFANSKDGVFADYFHVNDAQANMALIPESISDDVAVYVADMMSTGIMGAEHANIPVGGTVAVFALGPVGLMVVAGARMRGAGLVIGVESIPRRQELARHYGADEIVDYTKTDPVEEILRLTDGVGVDSCVEALGGQTTFEACVKATRPGGTISVVGYHGKGEYVMIPRREWGVGMSDKTIRTGLCPGGSLRLKQLLRLIEMGRVDPSPMTTHIFRFNEVDKALHLMETKEDGIIKPLIVF